MRVGSQGHYWQGMTYGTKRKPRGDGKPKGWKGRLKEQLKADGMSNNILGTDQI